MTALEVELPYDAAVFAWGAEEHHIQAAFSGCKIRPFSLSEEEQEALADMGGEVAAGRLSADAALWSVVKSRCDLAMFVYRDVSPAMSVRLDVSLRRLSADAALWGVVKSRCDLEMFVSRDVSPAIFVRLDVSLKDILFANDVFPGTFFYYFPCPPSPCGDPLFVRLDVSLKDILFANDVVEIP